MVLEYMLSIYSMGHPTEIQPPVEISTEEDPGLGRRLGVRGNDYYLEAFSVPHHNLPGTNIPCPNSGIKVGEKQMDFWGSTDGTYTCRPTDGTVCGMVFSAIIL